ncbi:non-ribosomal peptide synthetase [Actinacidiphila glaucinigra]|uniref:non-ribosomal peptide synthetase n=1 Tax=Actinacidiphila glaucinigra TaxID=235986 RepID=UPI003D8B2312
MNGDEVLGSVVPGPAAVPGSVLDRFDEQVRRAPQAPALLDGYRHWTYAELDGLARRTTGALRESVSGGDVIGVCMDHSAALVATAISVARLGAVYLPLGPRPGEERLRAVVRALNVRCLVGDPALMTGSGADVRLLPLESLGGQGTGAPRTVVAALRTVDPDAIAPRGAFYTGLTSGSTGVPKAVAISEASLVSVVHWYTELTGLGPGDRHSTLTSVAFDAHVLEVWAALGSGAALSVPPEAVRWSPVDLTEWWRNAGITVSLLPTPLGESVLHRPWEPDLSVRHLTVGGDRLRRPPAADVTAYVHNVYGPAETTVITTAHSMAPGATMDPEAAPPIGLPVHGSVVLVTDERGLPVPRGTAGELRIGGECVGLGYFDAELTARRFVPGPAGVAGAERVYRTGDRAVMRRDGVLEFLGRLDDQVKVRGVRVEPAEVELTLERHSSVHRAVVLTRRGDTAGTQLVAFVQPAGTADVPTAAELTAHAGKWLPEQAVPSVRVVQDFPLNGNGKIDRAALLAEDTAPSPAADDADPSSTGQAVLALCRELLDHPGLALDDNFVDAGGNSLAAARLLTALENRYGVRLRAAALLRQPDLRHLANLVDAERSAAVGAS